jgi:ribonucleoside-diphosphate reductase alpha chain
MDNKPYEVFTGKAENVDLPLSIEVGEIKKIKDETGKRYDFVYDGGVCEKISGISSVDYWNYGKLISGMLRHGMPLPFVVDTIQNLTWDEDHINTWKAGITRAMKKFIKDGKVEGIKCADCGSESIIFEEGCSKCLNCGSSKCG